MIIGSLQKRSSAARIGIIVCATAIFAICLSGCAEPYDASPVRLYSGPAREQDEISKIFNTAGAGLIAVDGTPVARRPGTLSAHYLGYELEAGLHTLTVGPIVDGASFPAQNVAIEIRHLFRPGEVYTFSSRYSSHDTEEPFAAMVVPHTANIALTK